METPRRFVAFDVETPNSRNDRMSAIGISVIEDGVISEEFYTVINPECHFDRFNIKLTGITPEMAAEAPTFGEIWQDLEGIFENSLLVAHNAAFDMGVLCRCLSAYGIFWKPYSLYCDTVQMGRKMLPELPNHKLNTVSEYLGIDLSHHQADSDAHACAAMLVHYLEHGVDISKFIRRKNFDV